MYLPAEWHEQEFVQLTWPHRGTDWADIYEDVIECYCNMAREISSREQLLIVCQYPDEVKRHLCSHDISTDNIRLFCCKNNDTWARDHGFISMIEGDKRYLIDFQFNGWGMKFASNFDNQINANMFNQKAVSGEYINQLDIVLEGGSIESDGEGTILTTTPCLMAPNRNSKLTKADIEECLLRIFNAKRMLWLDNSWLAGDDTDGHIDTVARFCDANTIAYVQCLDTQDEHYQELHAMEEQLKTFRQADGLPYHLIPLPMPDAIFDEDDVDEDGNPQRLPATYANFLIINGAVLYPTYNQPENDALAHQQLQSAFSNHELVPIDCRVLIRQHGSLHCCTMQFPR